MENQNIPWPLIAKKLAAIGKKPAWLASQLGIGTNVTSNWKSRGGAPLDRAGVLAKVFGCSADELLTPTPKSMLASAHSRDDEYNTPTFDENVLPGPDIKGWVPLISWVQAGDWVEVCESFTREDAEVWLPAPKPMGSRAFSLRVEGPSMEPKYQSGDIIFVDPDIQPEHGKRVVVQMEGDARATFKELVIDNGKKFLRPLNPDWPGPKFIPINGNATIVGVVVGKWVPE